MAAASYSVVHLKMRFNSTVLSTGSGMLYFYNQKYYIVTAWHNLTGRHPETLEIQHPHKASPNNVIVTMVREFPGMGGTRIPFIVPLSSEDETFYYVHPTNYPRIDVAIIPLDIDRSYEMSVKAGDGREFTGHINLIQQGDFPSELCPLQKYELSDQELLAACIDNIDVTDELFIPGYPENISDYHANPVWKRATVASSLKMGWNGQPLFLIDSASRPGMSGAPVFHYNKRGILQIGGKNILVGKEFVVFLGIYVGRMYSQEKDDAQIGMVWKREVVNEIIDGETLDWHSNLLEVGPNEIRKQVLSTLAKYNEEGVRTINDPNADYRYYATRSVHEALNGRAPFKEILQCVLEEASKYHGPYKTE
ncbi:hypothetical protein ACQKPC_22470 [Pseudomonas sp. NPDC089918]|uniref:hypothetical protein n=1 Tax=Pseudomonas sp. NPDC089918 TaxID=3390654 RepID=UPI003D00ACF4